MTKIQRYQLGAVLVLVAFVFYSYTKQIRNDFIFYPIVIINLILWFIRLRERRQSDHSK